jgi:uncharacterized membrane protein YbhN (UPF0104 family)
VFEPRIWVALASTIVAMWFAVRGVELSAVMAEFRRARFGILIGLSVPAYVLAVYVRALRWRYLTDAIAPMPVGALFRAVAVGFMANNLLPLRMGEFLRSWYLARETGTRGAAVLGTVIIERVIDVTMVILLALLMLWLLGGPDESTWQRGAMLLAPVALAPIGALVWLRIAPAQVRGIVAWLLRPFPERLAGYVLDQLDRFSIGLGALRGGAHLFWLGFHSLTIWLLLSALPMTAGFLALDIPMESLWQLALASWMTLAAVGIAVALPSAPGFFGVYHSACRLVLEELGLSPELAVALGTLLHAVFWLTFTTLGFVALRWGMTSLGDLGRGLNRR